MTEQHVISTPYDRWKKQIVTWLLCFKHNPTINIITKDVALIIARMIQADLSNWCYWNHKNLMHLAGFGPPYEWIWLIENERYCTAPCHICLKPRRISGLDFMCQTHGRQSEIKRSANCSCRRFGIARLCFDKIVANLNIQIHPEILITNEIFTCRNRIEKVNPYVPFSEGDSEYSSEEGPDDDSSL